MLSYLGMAAQEEDSLCGWTENLLFPPLHLPPLLLLLPPLLSLLHPLPPPPRRADSAVMTEVGNSVETIRHRRPPGRSCEVTMAFLMTMSLLC